MEKRGAVVRYSTGLLAKQNANAPRMGKKKPHHEKHGAGTNKIGKKILHYTRTKLSK
jgi:hypothetical protein